MSAGGAFCHCRNMYGWAVYFTLTLWASDQADQ